MIYRHTPRFQLVLQRALQLAAQEKGYSDQKMVTDGKLVCGKSTLNRFARSPLRTEIAKLAPGVADQPITRMAGSFLNRRDAANLWDHLDNRLDLVEKAVAVEGISKKDLYPIQEVANALHCFYGIHKSSMSRFNKAGISGNFFCYKPSFRKAGFTVKSLMSIESKENDFFLVSEKQRTSGRFEMDRIGIIERSTGLGLIKSNRLWLFLQDVETEQPRIFCLKPKFGQPGREGSLKGDVANSRISSLHGYLLEGAKGNRDDAFSFNVALIREDVEKELWKSLRPEEVFKSDEQIDIYPTSPEQKRRYREQIGERKAFIPEEIVEYLSGSIDNNIVES